MWSTPDGSFSNGPMIRSTGVISQCLPGMPSTYHSFLRKYPPWESKYPTLGPNMESHSNFHITIQFDKFKLGLIQIVAYTLLNRRKWSMKMRFHKELGPFVGVSCEVGNFKLWLSKKQCLYVELLSDSVNNRSNTAGQMCCDQSHYIEVAQGGVSSRARRNWLWIFSLFYVKKSKK